MLFHSIDKFIILIEIVFRFITRDSQIINTKIIIDTIEIYDPIDDTIFHLENASG